MNARGFSYVPRDRVPKILPLLKDGDIVGTVTEMAGMDVAHTGLIVREKGIPRFLHAPLSGKKVLISDGSVAKYVSGLRTVSGLLRRIPPEQRPDLNHADSAAVLKQKPKPKRLLDAIRNTETASTASRTPA